MEPPEISVYSLAEILSMDNSHIPIFLRTLRIPPSDDSRGQIALKLNQLGKLSYVPPINISNLAGLIEVTKPSQLTETQNIVRAAGITPSDDRQQIMIQYLTHATIPLAESPRFLPLKAEIPVAEIPVVGGLQFSELPTDVQLEILGRVSPTVREARVVSRGMQELADVALLDNIRIGNLVDPTLGIPDRAEYFKLKPDDSGDYFEPSPGLWRSIKDARKFYFADRQYLLIYGKLDLDRIRDRLTEKLREIPIPVTGTRVGGVMAARSLMASLGKQSLHQKLSEATNLLSNIRAEYGTNKIKFAGIAYMKSYESLTTGRFSRNTSSTLVIFFTNLFRLGLHVFTLKWDTPSKAQLIELIKQITENMNIEQIYKPDDVYISLKGGLETSVNNPEVSLRIVALNTDDLLNGTLILPSLKDDVYDVN